MKSQNIEIFTGENINLFETNGLTNMYFSVLSSNRNTNNIINNLTNKVKSNCKENINTKSSIHHIFLAQNKNNYKNPSIILSNSV